MRSAGKFRLWTGGYVNRPTVRPPGSLKLALVLCIVSVIGALWYTIAVTLNGQADPVESGMRAIFAASVHFILPVCIACAVTTNHPSSRYLILLYATAVVVTVLSDDRVAGMTSLTSTEVALIALATLLATVYWLFRSRRMRCYYALIGDGTVPEGLDVEARALTSGRWMNDRLRSVIDWLADRLETVVLIGFSITAILAYVLTAS